MNQGRSADTAGPMISPAWKRADSTGGREGRITDDPAVAFLENSRNVRWPSVVRNDVMPNKKSNETDGVRRRAARMAASLEPQDHAVLALRFGENLSIGETAAVLRMNPDEVRSTVSRVVGMLHRRVDS